MLLNCDKTQRTRKTTTTTAATTKATGSFISYQLLVAKHFYDILTLNSGTQTNIELYEQETNAFIQAGGSQSHNRNMNRQPNVRIKHHTQPLTGHLLNANIFSSHFLFHIYVCQSNSLLRSLAYFAPLCCTEFIETVSFVRSVCINQFAIHFFFSNVSLLLVLIHRTT